jgi:ParB family transcriptional regulator, chromosome partitioning protein
MGELRKVCAEPTCPVHHLRSRPQKGADDLKWKAEQEKQRREPAVADATGLRVLAAVSAAVPVRLMKRDLLFILERLVSVLDQNRLEMLARQYGVRQKRDNGGIGKTLAAYIRSADEGRISRLLVETTIVLVASRTNAATVLRDAGLRPMHRQ